MCEPDLAKNSLDALLAANFRNAQRIFLALMPIALVSVAVFAWLDVFNHFTDYDDEGWFMYMIRQMLDGKTLYHQVRAANGPAYYLSRWMIYGLFHVPLNNDTVGIVTWATFVLAAFLIGLIGWKMGGWLVAIVGVTAATQWLQVLGHEPGHPQELHVLLCLVALLAAAQWFGRASPRLDRSIWFILGASVSATILVKINVGAFYALALALSAAVWLLQGRASRLVLAALSVVALLLPWVLMRHRLDATWFNFAVAMNLAALPLCFSVVALPAVADGRPRGMVPLVLGGCVGVIVPLAFAMLQGNTPGDIWNALVVVPQRGYLHSDWGTSVALRRMTMPLTAFSTCVGMAMMAGVAWSARSQSGAVGRFTKSLLPWMRLLALGLFAKQIMTGPAASVVFIALSWLVLMPLAGDVRPAGHSRFFRYLVAWLVCLLPLQGFPVPGSQVAIGTIPVIILNLILFSDLLMDGAKAAETCRRWVSQDGCVRVLAAVMVVALPTVSAGQVGVAFWRLWRQRSYLVRLDLPGCRLTRVTEDQAAIYRFLAANVGMLSDGFLARPGQNSLHWWANVPLRCSRPIGDTWSLLDADDDAVITASYSSHPRLIYLDRPSYFGDQRLPDFQILRFIRANFRPMAKAWEFSLLVRKDRPDRVELEDLRSCAYPLADNNANRASHAAVLGWLRLRVSLPAQVTLTELTEIQMVDFATDKVIASTNIPETHSGYMFLGMVNADACKRVPLSAAAGILAREPGTALELHINSLADFGQLKHPGVRMLDANRRLLVLLPIVFAISEPASRP